MTKFKDETVRILLTAIQKGYSRRASCGLAGITVGTLRNWLINGRDDPDSEFADFCADFQQAEATAESAITDVVLEDALENRSFQAASWWLTKRRPEDYGNRTEVKQEIKGEISGAPTIADAQRIMREEFGGVTPETEEG